MLPTHLNLPREVPREPDALTAAGHDDGTSLLHGAVNDRNAAIGAAQEAVAQKDAAVADAAAARADVETITQGFNDATAAAAAAIAARDEMAGQLAIATDQNRAKDDEIARLGAELKLAQDELASLKEPKDAPEKEPEAGKSE
jgi:hypothetical protein